MALELGINSYVSLEDAETYFANRLDAGAWSDADDILKEQALVTAANQLNLTRWIGTIVDESQSLAFPRVGYYFEPMFNRVAYLDGTIVPNRIIAANMEYAYHLLNNDGMLDSAGSPDRIKVDVIELEGLQASSASVPTMSSTVTELINPLRYENGIASANRPANAWWRAY